MGKSGAKVTCRAVKDELSLGIMVLWWLSESLSADFTCGVVVVEGACGQMRRSLVRVGAVTGAGKKEGAKDVQIHGTNRVACRTFDLSKACCD